MPSLGRFQNGPTHRRPPEAAKKVWLIPSIWLRRARTNTPKLWGQQLIDTDASPIHLSLVIGLKRTTRAHSR